MDEVPTDRCGYTWPENHKVGDPPEQQSCCYRKAVSDADYCAWHADGDETDYKTIEELREVYSCVNSKNSQIKLEKPSDSVKEPSKVLLDGADLRGIDFEDAISFKSVSLRDSNLVKVDLNGADISSADVRGSDFTEANLRDTDIRGTILSRADLTGASLSRANLSGALLYKTDLTDASLLEANLSDICNLANSDFVDANLAGANLTGANLEDIDFTGANLVDADLTDAEAVGSTFREADLRATNLSGSCLEKANLTDVNLSEANLTGANLERALLNRADLFDARLAGARLEGTVLGNVQINEGTFEKLQPESDGTATEWRLTDWVKRAVLGPTGQDAYRCLYDPASQFPSPDAHQSDDGSDSDLDADERNNARGDGGETDAERVDNPEVRAGSVYRQFEQLAGDNALPEWQQRFFILRQDMQTRRKVREDYAFALLQRTLFGYGESFRRLVGWSSAIITVFSLIYLAGGWIYPVEPGGELGQPVSWTQLPGDPSVIWDSLYYSTLTFTALGFGDFRPTTTLGQFFTILETASGALLLALLVFVLGRRAAR